MSDRPRSRRSPDPPPVAPPTGLGESAEPPPLSIEQARLLPFYHDLRNEIVQPDKIVVTSQYFWTRWAPRLGPTLTALVVCLRRHCYYNRITQERRDWCFPEQATLAREIGVETTKTIRAALSHPLAACFVRREARYVYDPNRGKKVRTSDMYYVAMDDPLTPEDEALLALRAAERLMQEGRRAELALDAPPGAHSPSSAPRLTPSVPEPPPAKARRPRQPAPTGQKDRQDPPSQTSPPTGKIAPQVPDHQSSPQDSAVISGPEVVPEGSTNTTKYSTALSVMVEAFAAANGATPTPAQVARLGALATQFDPAARRWGSGRSGADWVLAAIREAVESGSRFVAPRRIARICERWANEGPPEEVLEAGPDLPPRPPSRAGKGALRGEEGAPKRSFAIEEDPGTRQAPPLAPLSPPSLVGKGDGGGGPASSDDRAPASFVVFPGLSLLSRPLWRAICDDARARLASPGDRQLLEGSQLLAREGSTLVVGVSGQAAARRAEVRLARPLAVVTRAILGREISLRFVSNNGEGGSGR